MRMANVVCRVLIVSIDLCLAEGKDASPVKTGLGLNADSVILLKECLTGDRNFQFFFPPTIIARSRACYVITLYWHFADEHSKIQLPQFITIAGGLVYFATLINNSGTYSLSQKTSLRS